MSRDFSEVTFMAPLAEPIELQATIAPDPGEFRLYIFHGTPGNRSMFIRLLRLAPRGLEVVLPTRPGFGKGHAKTYPDFDDQVAAMRPFLPGGAYGDKKLIVMGVSYGGQLALKAAMDFEDVVIGAVTVAALIDEPHDYALQLEQFGGDDRFEDFVPDRWRRVREEVEGRRSQIGPVLAALKNYRRPVEVLHGDFDHLVPMTNAETLSAALSEQSRSAVDIIPGGTHNLQLQYPRRVLAGVNRVIKRAGYAGL